MRPLWRKAARGSPPAPRKASTWNGNQLLPKKKQQRQLLFLFIHVQLYLI
ncbi:hypothetical protein QUF49_11270 [Fictibacillus sp. b24]|nr:hypothetical protein [Fictibacillus sp. b24]MDM5316575.1 hypothetical protein [Fictibacillus sp. b24]